MRGTRRLGLALYLLGLAASQATAQQRLAVLELAEEGTGLSAPALRVLADAARKAALGLDPERYHVVSREHMLTLLPPDDSLATLCAEGACEVMIGRAMGVELMLSGVVARLDGRLRADLKLHDVGAGRLLASETARGGDLAALEESVRIRIDAMLGRLPGARPATRRPSDFGAEMERLTAAQAARLQAEAEEAQARAAAEGAHQAEVETRWRALEALVSQAPREAEEGVADFLARYAQHPLGNPRAEDAQALKTRLLEARAAQEVGLAWRLARPLAEAGGREGRQAVEVFLTRFGADPLLNPHAVEAEQRLRALGGDPTGAAAGLEWVAIPAGSFERGSVDWDRDEWPVRVVTLPAFELSKSPVTVAQYARCVEAGVCTPPDTKWDGCNAGQPGREHHPVNCVDWMQARTFARWARARLPSEAEWEYAARSAGTTRRYPWGEAPATCAHAMVFEGERHGCGAGRMTSEVCTRPAGDSAQGVCDLLGNVWEWVADTYGDYRLAPTDGRPRDGAGERRVYRGGTFSTYAEVLRATLRGKSRPTNRDPVLGFRVAR